MDRKEFEEAVERGITHFQVLGVGNGSNTLIKHGEIVELALDDYSMSPAFYFPKREVRDSRNWTWIPLRYLEPVEIEESACTDTNAHYITKGVQPIEYCQQFMTKEQFEGSCMKDIVKYISRFGKKDNKAKEARKILDYALWLAMNTMGKRINPMKYNHTEIFKALGIEK